MVEKLEKSCIRFVHFSYENEHKSKVRIFFFLLNFFFKFQIIIIFFYSTIKKAFAEMLGLDTGWNCHISLATDDFTSPNISKQHQQHTNANIVQPPSEAQHTTTTVEVSELVADGRNYQQAVGTGEKHQQQHVGGPTTRRLVARRPSQSTTKSLPSGLKMRMLSSSKSTSSQNNNKSRAASSDKNQSSTTQIVKFDLTNLRRKSSGAAEANPVVASGSKQNKTK